MSGGSWRGIGRFPVLVLGLSVVLGLGAAGCGGGSTGGDENFSQVFEKPANMPPPPVPEKVNPKEKESPRERRAKEAANR
jgi:hypothetical protein